MLFTVPQPPPVSEQRKPRPHRGLSPGMAVLLALLAQIVMFGGIGLIYYSAVFHPAQLRAQATATVQTYLSEQTRATALANSQATKTTLAYATATATAQAFATAQAAATSTALQDIYNTSTSGSPALNDQLTGNDANKWDEGTATGGGSCMFTGGSYHSIMPQPGVYLTCMAEATDFSNFAFQVQMSILKGDGGGLVFRSNSGNLKAYRFRIDHTGSYAVFIAHDKNSSILTYGTSSATKTNQPILLTVIVRRSNMYFYINKQYIANVSDSTYSMGQIGIFAEDYTNPTEVAFNKAQVWIL